MDGAFCSNCGAKNASESAIEPGIAETVTHLDDNHRRGSRPPAEHAVVADGIASQSSTSALSEVHAEPKDVLFKFKANHFRSTFVADGGHVLLTKTELTFKPHAFNLPGGTNYIAYKDILDAQLCKTMGVLPNGVLVRLRDGREHRFLLFKPSEVLAILRKLIVEAAQK
jgi:hypothetical protein